MSTFYDKLATNAVKLLTKFGRTLVVKRFSKKYDPVSGLSVDNVEISSECIGVELPAKANASSLAKGDGDNYLIDLLRESKIRFLLIASNSLEFELAVNDVFIFDNFYNINVSDLYNLTKRVSSTNAVNKYEKIWTINTELCAINENGSIIK